MVIRYGEKSPETKAQIFLGRIVHSRSLKDLEIVPNGALGVSPDGTINFLSPYYGSLEDLRAEHAGKGFADAATVHLTPSQFLLPGLVDTHLHASQWENLALGMDAKLRDWTRNWTDPTEASFKDNDKARRVYDEVVKTTLRLGTTTVAYNTTIHAEATNILADAALKAGQRAIVGKMCITVGGTAGNCEKSVEAAIADSERSLKHIERIDPQRNLIFPCVQPRGGPYCPPELMDALGKQGEKYHAYFQGHMCETMDDVGP